MRILLAGLGLAVMTASFVPSVASAQAPKIYPRKCVQWMKWGNGRACTKYVSTGPARSGTTRRGGRTSPK